MRNLSTFKNFIAESKFIFSGETLFIDEQPDNYFEKDLLENRKFIDQKELADAARKALADGETVYIKLTGNPNRPVKTITHEFAKLLLDLINSIAYGEFKGKWSNLSEEQFQEVIASALKDILLSWDKSVDKPGLTDGQIYGNLRTLIKSRLITANNNLMKNAMKETPITQIGYDAMGKTIKKILGLPDKEYKPAVKSPEPGEKSWYDM